MQLSKVVDIMHPDVLCETLEVQEITSEESDGVVVNVEDVDLNCDTQQNEIVVIDGEVEIIVPNTKDDITKDDNTKDDSTKDDSTKDDSTKDDITKDDSTGYDNTKNERQLNGETDRIWECASPRPTRATRCRRRSADVEKQFSAFPDATTTAAYGKSRSMKTRTWRLTTVEATMMKTRTRTSFAFDVSNGFDCEIGRRFLDTHAMCSSPSAKLLQADRRALKPWDLTQLNIEAKL
ncbi:hypothetical protein LSTR_LSTR001745 [Laodelphax striatellus]|uniref:Uncharacterized protein n=1 Tax=Laodelphax striatellus TaxID=195883 RepID=A0A482XCC4_LAOST|nr:hypothetical protein LSTR_LSTR001745 [Laodelphax striatellus]